MANPLAALFGRGSQKRRIDALFVLHAGVSFCAGVVSVLLPNVFEWILVHHGQALKFRDNSRPDQKLSHVLTRLYGALVLSQAWIIWSARSADATMKRVLVQAYALVFGLSFLTLLRAQLTETPGIPDGMNSWNWLNIAVFGCLTLLYSNLAFVDKIRTFEGLDKSMS